MLSPLSHTVCRHLWLSVLSCLSQEVSSYPGDRNFQWFRKTCHLLHRMTPSNSYWLPYLDMFEWTGVLCIYSTKLDIKSVPHQLLVLSMLKWHLNDKGPRLGNPVGECDRHCHYEKVSGVAVTDCLRVWPCLTLFPLVLRSSASID